MAFIKEPYTESRVEMIYELLKKEADSGSPRDFEIAVDGLKVVSRNNDPERFYDFEQFVLPDSRNITIVVHEKSHRSVKYILLLQPEEAAPETLSGVEQMVTARIKQEKTRWDYKKLEEDYQACQQKLLQSEEQTRLLQEKIHQLETEKNNASGQLTNTLIGLAGAYISANPGALSGIPLIGSLFGKGKNQPALNGPGKECLCSNAPKAFTGEITVGDEERMKMALIPYFKEEYREKALKAISYFFHYNHYIDYTITGIEAALKNKNQETQETNKNGETKQEQKSA